MKETREERARRLILENSTHGLPKIKVLQELKLAYITGLSKQAAEFVRKEAFARRDDSGDPENDIYCMEEFAEDVYGGHTAVPANLVKEINKLILLCQDNEYIWIGIS